MSSNGSKPDPAIERLGRLLEKDWDDDDGDRISVVINNPMQAPKPSLWPAGAATVKYKGVIVAVATTVAIVIATVKVILDTLNQ